MNNIIIARGPAADIPHISLMLSSAAADVEVSFIRWSSLMPDASRNALIYAESAM